MITKSEDQRFQEGAREYAAYLEKPEGRLRTELVLANLQECFATLSAKQPTRVLDIGCGTGAMSVRMAQLGFEVAGIDSSETMLQTARRAADEAGVGNRIEFRDGDAALPMELFPAERFDAVLCHHVLEFVDDPAAVLRGAADVMRDSSSILSIVVRNRAGEVLKAALQSGDLKAAEENLAAEWGTESLFGEKVRLFTPGGLHELLSAAALEVMAERGVRVITDYLPPSISRAGEYARIFELERKLGQVPEFAAVARYTHCIARHREHGA